MYLTKSIKFILDIIMIMGTLVTIDTIHTSLDVTKIEQTQYFVAIVITGALSDTCRQTLYELGWKSLHNRGWLRRLWHFFNLQKSLHPSYLFAKIPDIRKASFSLRQVNGCEQIIINQS